LTMPDLEAAVAHPARVVVDSTVATPIHLRPLEHGADFVLHSGTKYLAGHHDALVGALVSQDAVGHQQLGHFRHLTGSVCAPDVAGRGARGAPAAAARQNPPAPRAVPRAQRGQLATGLEIDLVAGTTTYARAADDSFDPNAPAARVGRAGRISGYTLL